MRNNKNVTNMNKPYCFSKTLLLILMTALFAACTSNDIDTLQLRQPLTMRLVGGLTQFDDGTATRAGSWEWPNMNVGANSPEDYGDYFAWGETEPKSTYSWNTYKYCNGSEYTMTKYCTSSSYGTVDGKTLLKAADDAATANWGGTWRMPTHAEIQELVDNTSYTWTTLNGVSGGLFTSTKNGNSIFLPAAGGRRDSYLNCLGSHGYYSSSTLIEDNPYNAYDLDFDSGGAYWYYGFDRQGGLSVRPVR